MAAYPARRIAAFAVILLLVDAGAAMARGAVYQGGPVMLGTNHIYYVWYGNWNGTSATSILDDMASHIGGCWSAMAKRFRQMSYVVLIQAHSHAHAHRRCASPVESVPGKVLGKTLRRSSVTTCHDYDLAAPQAN